MTEKLYYIDSHIVEFEAVVCDISHFDDYDLIVLDKTAFFPEGGGQKADNGYINGIRIIDVFEKDGIIYHKALCCSEGLLNTTVQCSIDREVRFARMQAHSGEHILSGVINSLYGAENVGFHFDDGLIMTVDFNVPLTKDQLSVAEKLANEHIYLNHPVVCKIYSSEELKNISYRSKLEFEGEARIVEIEGVDKCACCAPHVSFTGEIGIIKILSSSSHRGGVRLTVICGAYAFSDYAAKYQSCINIASLLCARHSMTDSAVKELLDVNVSLRHKINELQRENINLKLASVQHSDFQVLFFDDIEPSQLREMANVLKEKSEIAVFLFSGNDCQGYAYCLLSEKINLKSCIREFNSELHGTGGGKDVLMQGKISASRDAINDYIEKMKVSYYANA